MICFREKSSGIEPGSTCWMVPVARGLFHIDPEAEGRGCLWGINAVHVAKGVI